MSFLMLKNEHTVSVRCILQNPSLHFYRSQLVTVKKEYLIFFALFKCSRFAKLQKDDFLNLSTTMMIVLLTFEFEVGQIYERDFQNLS